MLDVVHLRRRQGARSCGLHHKPVVASLALDWLEGIMPCGAEPGSLYRLSIVPFSFQAWVMQRLRVELHIKSLFQGKGI